jgi:hypothetical protein
MKSSFVLLSGTVFALVSSSLVACGGSASDPTGKSESELGSTASGGSDPDKTAPTPVSICKGGLPDVCAICEDGKSECAHWVIEHGKCEVQICPGPSTTSPPPSTTPPSSKPPSTTAVCKGGLPTTCEVCADGSDGCAHWAIVDGKCEVEYCSDPSTTPPPEPPPVSTPPVPAG